MNEPERKSQMTNAEAISEAIEGSTVAQMLLYDQYYSFVLYSVIQITGNKMDAEDFVHDAFLDAFSKLRSLKDPNRFGAWVKRIALNKALGQFRLRKLESLNEDHHQLIEEEHEGDNWTDYTANQILHQMKRLPDGYRVVLSLYLLDEFSHEEIAGHLGIAVSASRSQLSRAKQKLKQLMIQEHG